MGSDKVQYPLVRIISRALDFTGIHHIRIRIIYVCTYIWLCLPKSRVVAAARFRTRDDCLSPTIAFYPTIYL